MTIAELKSQFKSQISEQFSDWETDILWQIFGEKILGLDRVALRNSGHYIPEISKQTEFHNKLLQLLQGKPYQQVFGEADFFGLKFFVNENVLIPRPETEELLELALDEIQRMHGSVTTKIQTSTRILDIGTGSGIIPIVLQKHFPNAEVWAMDISEKALEIAQKNAALHNTEIHFIQADYLHTALTSTYDIIISNPPYIGQDEQHEIADSVKEFEPQNALFSPTSDPLIFYRKIAADCETHLTEHGLLFLEINQKLGAETLLLFSGLSENRLLKDISGNDRFVVGRK